ncbi:LemA family protein [Oxobacter pfennigii]|uniref:LemA family protein n=1 Tax=Oxobacter pfennigii TaxID=36849 RepID=A0A0P8W8L5_9CLOT|nr:LemA family protein [Oxobacter pfennigii]KPU45012.1 LemA family protein [Oxobacter pfennigii]
MKSKFMPIVVIIAIIAVLGMWIAGTYNGLVSKSEEAKTQQSNIQTQLQRRADLIPNLVNTVKGYAAHESEVIQSVADARSKLAGAASTQEALNANDELNSALSRLLVVVENYPDLKANANFRDLQAQLEGTENRITVARKDYNTAVQDYNTSIKRFPTVIIANIFGYKELPYFEASPQSQNVPEVNF